MDLRRRHSLGDARSGGAETVATLKRAFTCAFAVLFAGSLAAGDHWSFVPPRRPQLPAVARAGWVRNPVDRFVLARLEPERLAPSAEAAKTTLLRRLSLDLVGLPPTPVETAAFLADSRPDAYGRAVDRLLASPHFGEKWARHWLDLARYADSDGYESDLVRPHAWRYRHWVIDALNRDMPFDRFTIEQIAGDLLPHASVEQRVATGFHRNALTNREGGVDTEEFRIAQVIDRTNAVGVAWLGLTLGCAQCHDHKFDPLTQREYYQLFAFFNTMKEEDIEAPLGGELGPYLQARPAYEARRRALFAEYGLAELEGDWERKLLHAAGHHGDSAEWDTAWKYLGNNAISGQVVVRLEPGRRTRKQQEDLEDFFVGNGLSKMGLEKSRLDEIKKKFKELQATAPQISQAQTISENELAPKTRVMIGGEYGQWGREVQPGVPAFLPPFDAGSDPPRLALARWLVSRENPLTARVTVNRIWQQLFGRGLVRTSEDFGAQGEKPSHAALLDWLAVEFMDRGWSVKEMIRLIVTSATYRQSSAFRGDLLERDPENVLLARQSRLRLPAELIRDSALYAAGLLNMAVGGKSVRPPQPPGVAELGYSHAVKWEESTGADRYRRGLYIFFQRTVPYPQLMNFDAPPANLSCSRRLTSNTPLQALNLLNDPVFVEAAQTVAYRVLHERTGSFKNRLDYAFELCLCRQPSAGEVRRIERLFDSVASAEAAWEAVARVILNLDEFLHRE